MIITKVTTNDTRTARRKNNRLLFEGGVWAGVERSKSVECDRRSGQGGGTAIDLLVHVAVALAPALKRVRLDAPLRPQPPPSIYPRKGRNQNCVSKPSEGENFGAKGRRVGNGHARHMHEDGRTGPVSLQPEQPPLPLTDGSQLAGKRVDLTDPCGRG